MSTLTVVASFFLTCPDAAAVKASSVSSASAPSAIKTSGPYEHPARGRMAPSARAEETASAAGAIATPRRVGAATMANSANVTTNTVKSS